MTFLHEKTVYNKNAAREVLPLVFKICTIKSILDVGCGLGTWLAVSKDLGVEDITGVDGDWVNRDLLEIKNDDFINHDLNKPLNLNKKFDLVISLEVAEHIEIDKAEIFIESLVKHSDIILFSAAIKNQGGQNHLNEQDPEYWSKIFKAFGFEFYDILRPLIWNNSFIEYWYRQNIFIVARKGVLNTMYKPVTEPLTLVHPELLYFYQQPFTNQIVKKLRLNIDDVNYILINRNRLKIAYRIFKRLL